MEVPRASPVGLHFWAVNRLLEKQKNNLKTVQLNLSTKDKSGVDLDLSAAGFIIARYAGIIEKTCSSPDDPRRG